MQDMKKKAKEAMLKELSKTMSDDQNSPLKDVLGKKMQKVTVMSDSTKGLEKGLSKAEQILKKKESMMPEMEDDSEEESEDEMPESPEMEESEDSEEMSKEQIMEMISVLQKKLENC